MTRTILVSVGERTDDDHLEALAETAADLAGPEGSRVAVLGAFERDHYVHLRERLGATHHSEVTPSDVAGRSEAVRTVGRTLAHRGVAHEIRGALGDRAGAAVREAERLNADHVVVGGRRRTPTGKRLFGSDAQRVLLEAPCPVTLVTDDAGGAGGRVRRALAAGRRSR